MSKNMKAHKPLCKTELRKHTPLELKANMNFGKRVRARRKVLYWTADDLAEDVGVTSWTIYNIESGHCAPQLKTAARLARALSVTLDELVGDDYE